MSRPRPTVLLAVGARPTLMQAAALLRAFARVPSVRCRLVHTGQHYDDRMSGVLFGSWSCPPPT